MAATVQSSSNFISTGSTTSDTLTLPTGWQQDDVLYIFCELVATAGSITTPGGYTAVVAPFHSAGSTSATMAVFRKVLTASETDPAIAHTNGRLVAAGILVRGADTTTPEDVTATTDTGGSITGTSGAITAPDISPTNTNTLLLCAWGIRNGSNGVNGSFSQATGMTEQQDITSTVGTASNPSLAVDSEARAASGATGTRSSTVTVTSSETFNTQGVSVSVRSTGGTLQFLTLSATPATPVASTVTMPQKFLIATGQGSSSIIRLSQKILSVIAQTTTLLSWTATGFFRPSADLDADAWTTAPLYPKVSDVDDSTIITTTLT